MQQGINAELRAWIVAEARAGGFDLAGVSAITDDAAEQLSGRFAEWIAAGHAGEMEWLKRSDAAGEFVRGDLRRSLPWARSVIVCAANYNADAPKSTDAASPEQGWIARYAWSGAAGGDEMAPPDVRRGADYHDVLVERLQRLEAALRERLPGIETKAYVDTGPVVERAHAVAAGVGWIGKNTCVLNQQQGSWLLLGVVVTSLEVLPDAVLAPAADRCGTCTRCIDACPTDALIAPRVMDAARCIAYLTIEKKGAIDEDLRAKMGRQVFGCDICQDVCPWNRRAPIAAEWEVREALVNPSLEWLAAMDGPTFNRWFRGTPLERTRRRRLQRNVAIAMGNIGRAEFLPRLAEWAAGDDDVLAETARWAATQIHRVVGQYEDGLGEHERSAGGS